MSGKCPSVLGGYIASAPVTPLVKPWGGIRPITVGTVWWRLVSKVGASVVGKTLHTYFQFGVGTHNTLHIKFFLNNLSDCFLIGKLSEFRLICYHYF